MNRNHLGRRRRIALLATSVLTVGTLAACATTPSTPDEPVDLTVAVWTANEAHLEIFNAIGDAYVEANPESVASVTFDTIPFDSYTSTLTTRIASNDAPDLAWVLEGSAPEFIDAGALTALTETLEGTEGYEFDDLNPAALELWSEGDDLYAYPFSTSPQITVVNNTLFAAAGQPTPREMYDSGDWNWDSVRTAAAAITAETGVTGYMPYPASWQYLSTLWGGFGAAPWSEDGTECTYDSPEMVEAYQFVSDGIYEDAAFAEPGSNFDFFTGQAAMIVTGLSQTTKLDGSFEWDVLPLPEGPEGRHNIIGQAGIGVLSAGENPQQAADFLAFFTNPENAADLVAYFPAPRESVTTAAKLAEVNPLLSEDQLQLAVIDTVSDATTYPAHPNFAAISNALTPKLDAVWAEGADIQAALTDVCTAIQPLLEK